MNSPGADENSTVEIETEPSLEDLLAQTEEAYHRCYVAFDETWKEKTDEAHDILARERERYHRLIQKLNQRARGIRIKLAWLVRESLKSGETAPFQEAQALFQQVPPVLQRWLLATQFTEAQIRSDDQTLAEHLDAARTRRWKKFGVL
ncbi:MAG TPA: hypothetical protein PLL06_18575 [Acidobacteriota bacterium]|nr:hypothetical protein [Acidobacteriota bacterium]HNJ42958.1 hypothetical protein [Acidobacteriota bacterium]